MNRPSFQSAKKVRCVFVGAKVWTNVACDPKFCYRLPADLLTFADDGNAFVDEHVGHLGVVVQHF